MLIKSLCSIIKNTKVDHYMAVEGTNKLTLMEDDGKVLESNIANVLWCGSGTPFPTPPGGPWVADYLPNHSRFGRCFFVHSDMETEIFIHFAQKKSYGCLIINPTDEGKKFMRLLIDNRSGLRVIQLPIADERSAQDKARNPIDYKKIGKIK